MGRFISNASEKTSIGEGKFFYGNTSTDEISSLGETYLKSGIKADINKYPQVKSLISLKWDNYSLNTLSGNLMKIAYGNGVFVCVSANTSEYSLSSDGKVWTKYSLPISSFWRDICFGNGVFVLISALGGTSYTSPDGINWTARTMPMTDGFYTIVFGNGLFIAFQNTQFIATSTNGITWTKSSLPISMVTPALAFINGTFFAASGNSTNLLKSTDGLNWTVKNLPVSDMWRDFAYGNGEIVLMTTSNNNYVTSSDGGENWIARVYPKNPNAYSIAFGNGYFIVPTTNFDGCVALVSTDAVNWKEKIIDGYANTNYSDIIFANNLFVAVDYYNKKATVVDSIIATPPATPNLYFRVG